MNVFCLFALAKIQTNYHRTNFFLQYFCSVAQPFHRSDDNEGSRSIAERFVVVTRTKPSPAHVQRLLVTFPVANIVTLCAKGKIKSAPLIKDFLPVK